MKKVNTSITVLFFAMLFSVQSSFCIEYPFTFINRTGRWIKLFVIERGNPMSIICRGKKHEVKLRKNATETIKTGCCIVQVNIHGSARLATVGWKSVIPKCRGTAKVTKVGDTYKLKWIK